MINYKTEQKNLLSVRSIVTSKQDRVQIDVRCSNYNV